MPGTYSHICGCHFVGGKPNSEPNQVAYMPTIFPIQPSNSDTCIVIGCDHKSDLHLLIDTENKVKTNLWIQAIREHRSDNNWMPDQDDKICGRHFVGGKPGKVFGDLDFLPSMFPVNSEKEEKKAPQNEDKPSPEKDDIIYVPSDEKLENEAPQNEDKANPEKDDIVYVPIPHFTSQAQEAR